MSFPKRNLPYSEDQGKRAVRWTVQGYIIVSPRHTDYIPARDALITELEADGPAYLKLPTFEPMLCMCDQYRVDETRERGGICVFDMIFVERGSPPVNDVYDATQERLGQSSDEMASATQGWLNTIVNDAAVQGPGGSMAMDSANAFMQIFGGGRGG
jgi:prophage DNA circulation protein